MELAPGKPAVRYTREGERLRPIEAVKVGLALCKALAAVHARGVLHRDINMNNVMIGFEREPTVKLLDFGSCELRDRYYAFDQRYPAPLEARGRLGTGGLEKLEWSAPEVRAGQPWTERSDVYSVALLLYRLLTGRLPFRGKDRGKLIRLRDNLPTASPELESALLAALNPDPEARLGLVELIDRLTDIEDEASDSSSMSSITPAPRAARASPPRERTAPSPRPAWPRRAAFVAAPLALTVTVVMATIALWRTREPESASTARESTHAIEAPRQPPRSPTPSLAAPSPAAREPSPAEALGAATAQLRRCAQGATGELFLELTVAPGVANFTAIDVVGADPEDARCIRGVLDEVRFSPPGAPYVHMGSIKP